MKAENNRLIAEFLGYTQPHPDYPTTSYWYKEGEEPLVYLSFNTDWNWLMKAVEKILNLSLQSDSMEDYYNITDSIPKIDQCYKAVVKFVEEYNKRPFRIYGIEVDDIPEDFDYENCSDERFMDEAERCGLVWEDFDEFIEQLNNGDINKEYTRFRTIKL